MSISHPEVVVRGMYSEKYAVCHGHALAMESPPVEQIYDLEPIFLQPVQQEVSLLFEYISLSAILITTYGFKIVKT